MQQEAESRITEYRWLTERTLEPPQPAEEEPGADQPMGKLCLQIGPCILSRGRIGQYMTNKRRVEVFSAGCALCEEVLDAVRREAAPSCVVVRRNMLDSRVLRRADELGIRSIPAVV